MANRPRGRPEKATPEIRQLISESYVELSRNGERPYVEDVYGELVRVLSERKTPVTIAKSTVGRIMRELKDEAGRTQNEEGELDQPWSIGASLTHGIPPDIIPTLLEIQRLCILVGQTVSVREARWVSYLQHTADMKLSTFGTMFAALYRVACRYALKEKASKLLGKATIDTSDLDLSRMQWNGWVRQVAEQTGAIPTSKAVAEKAMKDRRQLYLAELEKRGQTPADGVYEIPFFAASPEMAMDAKLDIDPPPGTAAADTPAATVHLDSQSAEVYALCISYLSKGPNWDSLTKENRDGMAEALKAEIRGNKLKVQIAKEERLHNAGGDIADLSVVFGRPRMEDWKLPAEFQIAVGYEAPEEKGDTNG